ncbi:MAG: hypothetical protein SGPRY_004038 [Prymnesium sp.]
MVSPITRNFVLMTAAFSLNHGCVLAVLNVAVILLGDHGAYQSGSLYVSYAATALLISPALLEILGARKGLIYGAALYSVYVISLPIALVVPSSMPALEIAVALFGGIVGGIAAGFLWSAQGAYFALNAKKYAIHAGVSASEANDKFASIFASIFLGLEVALKLLPAALTPLSHDSLTIWGGKGKSVNLRDLIIASLYSILAVGAVFVLQRIEELEEERSEEEDTPQPSSLQQDDKQAALLPAAVTLWSRQPVVLLLAPIQITFGVSASLLAYQVTGKVLPSAFGTGSLIAGSLLSALVAAVAASLQLPFKHLTATWGKPPLMVACILAFVILSAIVLVFPLPPSAEGLLMTLGYETSAKFTLERFLLLPAQNLGSWPLLLSCYFLQGVGRACYEGTNKALYADFFPDDSTAAFSNIVLANGAHILQTLL